MNKHFLIDWETLTAKSERWKDLSKECLDKIEQLEAEIARLHEQAAEAADLWAERVKRIEADRDASEKARTDERALAFVVTEKMEADRDAALVREQRLREALDSLVLWTKNYRVDPSEDDEVECLTRIDEALERAAALSAEAPAAPSPTVEEVVDWIRCESRECGCSDRILAHLGLTTGGDATDASDTRMPMRADCGMSGASVTPGGGVEEAPLPCSECGPIYDHPDVCICEGDCSRCHREGGP